MDIFLSRKWFDRTNKKEMIQGSRSAEVGMKTVTEERILIQLGANPKIVTAR